MTLLASRKNGGFGDDQIWGGSNVDGKVYLYGDDDDVTNFANRNPLLVTSENALDGDDVIDVGDGATGAVKAFGQGGNDKIIGGIDNMVQSLYGGSGDDKIWRYNPG